MGLPIQYPPLPPCARVVATCGISGSGKTTYAKSLEPLGFRRLSLDRIVWESRPATFEEMPLSERREFFSAASGRMLQELDESLSAGMCVVVDATMCKRAGRDALRAVCRRHGLEPQFVYFPADKATLAARLAARGGAGPDDQKVSEDDLDAFCLGFEPPASDEPVMVI